MPKVLIPSKPRFSVITVVRNAAGTIEETIESVLSQEPSTFEYIVIDNLSSDGTSEIISKYKKQLKVYVRESDQGIYDAMNKGINLANGEWVSIINADDLLMPNCLKKVEELLSVHAEAEIVYGNVVDYSSNQEMPQILHDDLFSQMIYHPAVFVKRIVYESLGGFDTSYRISADYEFMLRAFTEGKSFKYLPSSLAKYRSGGYSNINWKNSVKEFESVKTSFKLQGKLKEKFNIFKTIQKTIIRKNLNKVKFIVKL